MVKLDNTQKQLFDSLNDIINKNGFQSVLFVLEHIAAMNDEMVEDGPWDSVRESIDDSFKNIEEWYISKDVN